MRQVEKPENFKHLTCGYLAEMDKMHAEVMKYLSRHASEPEDCGALWPPCWPLVIVKADRRAYGNRSSRQYR
jgi:hypothetical protein